MLSLLKSESKRVFVSSILGFNDLLDNRNYGISVSLACVRFIYRLIFLHVNIEKM